MGRRGYASNADGWIDDEDLERLVTERIDNDPAFWISRGRRRTMIVVQVDDGYVTLNGIVRSPAERRRADIIARAAGAQGVDNRLRCEAEVSGESA